MISTVLLKNQLITYGVTLNKCYELGLDKGNQSGRASKNVDAKLDQAIAGYKVRCKHHRGGCHPRKQA